MIERILEIGTGWYNIDKVSDADKQAARTLYREYTKKTIGNCASCFATIYQYFSNLKTKPMNNGQFKLKKGKVLMSHGAHQIITESNLTDDKALLLLKESPGSIKFFETFPENWEELSKGFDPIKSAREEREAKKAADKGNAKKAADKVDEKKNVATPNQPQGPVLAQSEKQKDLETKTVDELCEIAKSNELPEAEYTTLDKEALINYLLEKIK